MAMKQNKNMICLAFFMLAFLIFGCTNSKAKKYIDIEGLTSFNSVKIIDNDKIKLTMNEFSYTAMNNYPNPEDRIFVLEKGESLEVFPTKAKDYIYKIRFVGLEGDNIIIGESYIEKGGSDDEILAQLAPYPNIKNVNKKENVWPDKETMKVFMAALLSASESGKKDTSYKDSDGLNLFYSVQIVDDEKLQLKISNELYKNSEGDFSFYLNKDVPKKFSIPLDNEQSLTFDLEFKGVDSGKILIKEDMYMFGVKAGENYYRFEPYSVDKTKSLLFNLGNLQY